MEYWIAGLVNHWIDAALQNSNTPSIHQSNNPVIQNFLTPFSPRARQLPSAVYADRLPGYPSCLITC